MTSGEGKIWSESEDKRFLGVSWQRRMNRQSTKKFVKFSKSYISLLVKSLLLKYVKMYTIETYVNYVFFCAEWCYLSDSVKDNWG